MTEEEKINQTINNSFKNKPIENKNDFNNDKILLKLHRQYEKDEIIKASQKRLSEIQIELGKWKSYAEELEDNFRKIEKSKSKIENKITEATNQKVKEFRKEFNEIKRENLELKEYVKHLLK